MLNDEWISSDPISFFMNLKVFIIIALMFVIFLGCSKYENVWSSTLPSSPCHDHCRITLVESIPENLTFSDGSPTFPSTFHAWQTLLNDTEKSLDLAVFYWSLKNEDVTPVEMPSSWQGEEIFRNIKEIGKSRSIDIRIAQNHPNGRFGQNNSKELEDLGLAKVRSVNFDKLLGGGVLHTKLWISDDKHFYLGSANMDWQSLTQVKEVGVLVQNCSCLAKDIKKIFEVYWILGKNASTVPPSWPYSLYTSYNMYTPMNVQLSGHSSLSFLSSSPLPFNPRGRTNDIDALVSVIRSAEKFVYIAVMDYFPRMLYGGREFWPVIDDELRRVAYEKKVLVRLLASHWSHTRPDMSRWMGSLRDVSGPGNSSSFKIETKLFTVPVYTKLQKLLPFARVNHNKYMVTDKAAFVGTSNWSGDYFTKTGGVSLIVANETSGQGPTLRAQLESLFLRDWNSKYAKDVQ